MSRHWNEETLESALIRALVPSEWQIEEREKKGKERSDSQARLLDQIEKLKELYLHDLLPREIYERDYKRLWESVREEEMEDPVGLPRLWEWGDLYGTLSKSQKKAFWCRSLKRITLFPDRPATVRSSES